MMPQDAQLAAQLKPILDDLKAGKDLPTILQGLGDAFSPTHPRATRVNLQNIRHDIETAIKSEGELKANRIEMAISSLEWVYIMAMGKTK